MKTIVSLYSNKENEIENFLKNFYNTDINLENKLEWEQEYENPIEIADIIGVLIDNNDKYNINMWISMDPEVYININDHNVEKIMRYLFERYPY